MSQKHISVPPLLMEDEEQDFANNINQTCETPPPPGFSPVMRSFTDDIDSHISNWCAVSKLRCDHDTAKTQQPLQLSNTSRRLQLTADDTDRSSQPPGFSPSLSSFTEDVVTDDTASFASTAQLPRFSEIEIWPLFAETVLQQSSMALDSVNIFEWGFCADREDSNINLSDFRKSFFASDLMFLMK